MAISVFVVNGSQTGHHHHSKHGNSPKAELHGKADSPMIHSAEKHSKDAVAGSGEEQEEPHGINLKEPVSVLNYKLMRYVKGLRFDEADTAKNVRLLLERGASPLVRGLSKLSAFSKLNAIEGAIKRRRALVLEALFAPPSPVSYEALEKQIERFPAKRRDIELLRTEIVRYAVEETRHKEHIQDTSGERVMEVLSEANIFIFAEEYMNALSLIFFYLVVVFLLVIFLYNLRIKQVPETDVLLVPREEDTLWTFLRMVVSTLTTTIPTSNMFEIAGYGLALIGGIAWSQVFTTRNDLGLVLVLCSLFQTTLTLMCYMTYTPMVEPGHVALAPSLYRIMMYPKKSDWNRSIVRCSYYLIACTLSYYIAVHVLTPTHKMYSCPTPSISDTYGFDYSLTRTVAVTWDIIIFFSFTLRVYRTIDTFVSFDLIRRMFGPSSSSYKEADDVSVSNA